MNGEEQGPHTPNSEPSAQQQQTDEQLQRFMPGLPPDSDEIPGWSEVEEDQPDGSPHVYVASLSDYNAGRLHGCWIDATREVDEIWARVNGMLALSPELNAEEWAIHDYEGFGPLRLREYESVELVSEIAQGIAEHGEAFAAFVELAERDQSRFPLFEDMYRGRWESLAHYAESLLQDMGADQHLARLPEWLRNNVMIHVEGFAEELEANGSVTTADASEGGVYVFDFDA